MEDQDKKRFAEIMHGLAEDKGVQLSAQGLALRFEALRQFPIADIYRAALAMMASRKYSTMPAVSDFLEYLGGGPAEDRAEIEANRVINAVSDVGGYKDVVFDDPVTQAVIFHGFGGWAKMCSELMDDQRKWFVKDFSRMYASFSRSQTKYYGKLTGRGHCKEPKLIGNPQKAAEILQIGNDQTNKESSIAGLVSQIVSNSATG